MRFSLTSDPSCLKVATLFKIWFVEIPLQLSQVRTAKSPLDAGQDRFPKRSIGGS